MFSKHFTGVVWPNDLFSMGCPECANRENVLFVADILGTTETVSDDFVLLSPSKNKHVSSPKFTDPTGDILIYLENDIASTLMTVIPGSSQKSRRLIRMNFTQSVTVAMSSDGIVYGEPYLFQIVDQVYEPDLEDDSEISFRGIYPIEKRVQDRIFSHEGDIAYLNIFQREANRIAAVDIYSSQVTLHPETNLQHLDIVSKLVLIINTGNVNRTSSVQIGLLIPPPPPPPTTIEPTTPVTTEAVPQTTTTVQTTSTMTGITNATSADSTLSITTEDEIIPTSTEMESVTTSTTVATNATTTNTVTDTTISNATTNNTPEEATSDFSSQATTESTTIITIDPCEDLLQELEHADVSNNDRFRRDVEPKIENVLLSTQTNIDDSLNVTQSESVHITDTKPLPLNLFFVKFHDVVPPSGMFDYEQEVISLFDKKEEEEEGPSESTDGTSEEEDDENEEGSGLEGELQLNSSINVLKKENIHDLNNSVAHRISNSRFDKSRRQGKLSKYSWKLKEIGEAEDKLLELDNQGESYHAIYVAPRYRENVPLIVIIHDGPHALSTTSYSAPVNFFLSMNMAVLSINYKGSTGMGDKNLELIMGFASQVRCVSNLKIRPEFFFFFINITYRTNSNDF